MLFVYSFGVVCICLRHNRHYTPQGVSLIRSSPLRSIRSPHCSSPFCRSAVPGSTGGGGGRSPSSPPHAPTQTHTHNDTPTCTHYFHREALLAAHLHLEVPSSSGPSWCFAGPLVEGGVQSTHTSWTPPPLPGRAPADVERGRAVCISHANLISAAMIESCRIGPGAVGGDRGARVLLRGSVRRRGDGEVGKRKLGRNGQSGRRSRKARKN